MGPRSAGPAQGSLEEWPAGSAYVLEGSVLEVWGGSRLPRVRGAEPPPPPSIWAWWIRRGLINGVNVSGQVVVVLSRLGGALEGRLTGVILLDEQASPEQALALFDAFRGRLGGPLGNFGWSATSETHFSQVPIEYRLVGGLAFISVPDRIRVVARVEVEGSGPLPPSDPDEPPPGTAARPVPAASVSVDVNVAEYDLAWHGTAAAACRDFHYHFAQGTSVQEATSQTSIKGGRRGDDDAGTNGPPGR